MSDLLIVATMIQNLAVDDRDGHAEASGRMWCAMDPETRRFIAISPGGEPWCKYEGGDRRNKTLRGLVFERVDFGTKAIVDTGARIQQYISSPQYSQSLDLCARTCNWIVGLASESELPSGRAVVKLYDRENWRDATGYGTTLSAAWASAICRAVAIERGEDA